MHTNDKELMETLPHRMDLSQCTPLTCVPAVQSGWGCWGLSVCHTTCIHLGTWLRNPPVQQAEKPPGQPSYSPPLAAKGDFVKQPEQSCLQKYTDHIDIAPNTQSQMWHRGNKTIKAEQKNPSPSYHTTVLLLIIIYYCYNTWDKALVLCYIIITYAHTLWACMVTPYKVFRL